MQYRGKGHYIRVLMIVLAALLPLILFPESCYGKDTINLGLVGRWGYNRAVQCVEMLEIASPPRRYAYCGTGEGLLIVDVTDPNRGHVLTSLDFGKVNGIAISGPERLALLAVEGSGRIVYDPGATGGPGYGKDNRLVILDIGNPERPVYLGEYTPLQSPQDIAVAGNWAAIADGENGLVILDITDPGEPSYLGGYRPGADVMAVIIAGNDAILACGVKGLAILDISDPREPVYIGGHDTLDFAEDVVFAGNRAYVADGFGGLSIIDIADPSNPAQKDIYDTEGYSRGISLSGGLVYIADWTKGITVIDVTDPNEPAFKGHYAAEGCACGGIALAGHHAYVADMLKGLTILDVSNPANPKYFREATGGEAWGVAVTNTHAFIAGTSGGIAAVDVKDAEKPRLKGEYDTTGESNGVAISGAHAYVADGTNGLLVIDIADPNNPQYIGGYQADAVHPAKDVALSGENAYVAYGTKGLVILDVSDPNKPRYQGGLQTSGIAQGIALKDDYAHLACGTQGLVIIDVSDPNKPLFGGGFNTGGLAQAVALSGSHAYVADGYNGLQVIDVSDPNKPSDAGCYDTGGFAQDVLIAGNRAYVACAEEGIAVFDVTDPTAIIRIEGRDTPGIAMSLAISGEFLYAADAETGLLLFRIIDTPSPLGNLVLCPSGPASVTNSLWPASGSLANSAYSLFLDQNYPDYGIYYLNPDPYQDLDRDGIPEPLVVDDFDPTAADLELAITGWAADQLATGPLILYLPGLGTRDAYQIFPGEVIRAIDPNSTQNLKDALDTFQAGTGRDVICILEFLSSGHFAGLLLDPNTGPCTRSVIACTDSGVSYINPEGTLSFTGRLIQLLKGPPQAPHILTDTGISRKERVSSLQSLFSKAREEFWLSGNPYNTQPPQMLTTCGSHTLCGITLAPDPVRSSYSEEYTDMVTITDPNQYAYLEATGHYLDGNAPLNDQVCFHSSDPSVLLVTQEGKAYANPGTHYNGTAFVMATIIDPNFSQAPGRDPALPQLGGVTGRIPVRVSMAARHEKEDLPKAVIIAGRLDDPAGYDYLWESTNRIAAHACHTLLERGYSPGNICYLSHDQNQPGVDGPAPGESMYGALESLFTSPDNGYLNLEGITDLTILLIDHGKKDRFILGPQQDQFLTPAQLDLWLDSLQTRYPAAEITVIVEACYSGGFLKTLTEGASNRIVITSTQETAAYLAANGWVSFSYFLMNYLGAGSNIADAFGKAYADIAALSWGCIQHPVLAEAGAGGAASMQFLGGSFVLSQGQPQILRVSEFNDPNTHILPHEPLLLWAKAADLDGIESVWAVISNSQGSLRFSGSLEDPLMAVNLPRVELLYNPGLDRYEGTYAGFSYSGPYTMLFLARDSTGMVSYPRSVYLTVEGSNQDYAILFHDPDTKAYADFAQWVLEERRFPGDAIVQVESIAGLHAALDGILANPPEALHHLILYAVSEEDMGSLDPNTLDRQLDEIQEATDCTVICILDADRSGRLLPGLAGEKRAHISAADRDHQTSLGTLGQPFSQFFFSGIYNGMDVNQAYHAARFAIGYYSAQNPLLDDNGNGMGSEYGAAYDGKFSQNLYLGSPHEPVMAGPRITVPAAVHINGWKTSQATLWAMVQDPNSFVWALVITPAGEQESVVLSFDPVDGRFEAEYGSFTSEGVYRVVVYVQEQEGLLDYDESPYIVLMPDQYEADNTPDNGSPIMVNQAPRQHSFHLPGDEDWVSFYGYKNLPYEVRATRTWSDCPVLIEVFDSNLAPVGYTSPYAVGFAAPENGIYLARISYTCPTLPAAYPAYYLSVVCPSAGTGGIWGWVRDAEDGFGIVGAQVCTPAGQCVTSMVEWNDPSSPLSHIDAGFFFMDALPVASGGLQITASAEGYLPASKVITGYSEDLLSFTLYLERDPAQTYQPAYDPDLPRQMVRYMLEKKGEIKVSITLYEGLNLFSHPAMAPGSSYYSTDFLVSQEHPYNPSAGPTYFSSIRRYDSAMDTYDACGFSFSGGVWSLACHGGVDFPILSGESNPVYMLQGKTLEFAVPIPTPAIDLQEGTNYVGIPFPPAGYTSHAMLRDIGGPDDAASICRFDPATGTWENAYWDFARPAGEDFPIRAGEGYLVIMKRGIADWYPEKGQH